MQASAAATPKGAIAQAWRRASSLIQYLVVVDRDEIADAGLAINSKELWELAPG
jgi:hypothetical protein